jgi:uncharacterized protein (TIGR03118 family)
VANAFTTGKATFYTASGHVLPQTITVPGSATGSAALGLGAGGHPTGVVYNPTSNFVISENGKSAPALLIFDSIDGTISGWNPAVDPNHAILIKDTFAVGTPAVFTSLAMAQNSRGQTVLYATDYLNNRVDMFDSHFNLIGSFTDPNVTSVDPNLSAWSVQAQGGKLYVTFADLQASMPARWTSSTPTATWCVNSPPTAPTRARSKTPGGSPRRRRTSANTAAIS